MIATALAACLALAPPATSSATFWFDVNEFGVTELNLTLENFEAVAFEVYVEVGPVSRDTELWFDAHAAKHGFTVLTSWEGRSQLSSDEEKTDLRPFFDKFKSAHSPKLGSDVAVRIIQKPGGAA
ncbi:MAG: hypothetical protein KJO36_09890 [Acidimicrobiia bacterium]|nr:hypothetical protein [Acidimicrobiia bacterium]